jgi:hypothetical protein
MITTRILRVSVLGAVLVLAPTICAQDFSTYREFRLGADIVTISKQVEMNSSDALAIHERPALIQELEWRVQNPFVPRPEPDSVKSILFSFYNGELYRMVVRYDPERTEGMTLEDLVEAVSARYGTATRPVVELDLSSTWFYDGERIASNRKERVLARWENSEYSFNLFQSSILAAYGLAVYSKRLDALAQTAISKAIRLDEQEAGQRGIDRQNKKDEANRLKQEKARKENKAPFRP